MTLISVEFGLLKKALKFKTDRSIINEAIIPKFFKLLYFGENLLSFLNHYGLLKMLLFLT